MLVCHFNYPGASLFADGAVELKLRLPCRICSLHLWPKFHVNGMVQFSLTITVLRVLSCLPFNSAVYVYSSWSQALTVEQQHPPPTTTTQKNLTLPNLWHHGDTVKNARTAFCIGNNESECSDNIYSKK